MRDRIVSAVGRYLPEIEITKLSIISLDENWYTGIPGLKITLAFKLKNTNDVPSDITVKVGV
jgi:hypothetical protein